MLILLINTLLPWKEWGKLHRDLHDLPIPPFKWSRSLLFLVQKLFQCIQQKSKTFMSKIVNPAKEKNKQTKKAHKEKCFNYFLIKCKTCKAFISSTACASLHRLHFWSHFPKMISHKGKQFQKAQTAESHSERWEDIADSCKHSTYPYPGCWQHCSPVNKH